MDDDHVIPYPEQYKDKLQDGAAAFAGKTDHPASRYYVFNDYFNMESDETLHILTHFQTYQQTTEYTCGAASALMVLNWFGRHRYHEMVVAELIDSIPEKGSAVENVADFFDLIGWKVDYHASVEPRFETPKDLEQFAISCIDKQHPILVDWVDWAGHWQVIIGIDTCGTETPYDDVLILADPYDVTNHFQNGYYTFPLARFFYMWREGPCAQKAEPFQQPFVVAWPEDAEDGADGEQKLKRQEAPPQP